MKTVVRAPAAADIESAFQWYRLKRTGLGHEFLQALRAAMSAVAENPEAYPVLHRSTRRIRLRRFPYGLFYRLYPGVIVIVACMHARRDPVRWKRR